MRNLLNQAFTDSLGRFEIKNVLAVALIVSAAIYIFIHPGDGGTFAAIAGTGVGLFVTSSTADTVIDKANITNKGTGA